MLPVLMLIARILELRFHMPWGDEPVYNDIISVLHRLRGHGSPMLRQASMPILRSLILTYQVRFCFFVSVSQRVDFCIGRILVVRKYAGFGIQ